MNRLFRYGVFATALALIVALVVPLAAQEVTPGEGGIIIEGNFGGDPATFNPLLASDTSSARWQAILLQHVLPVSCSPHGSV